MSGTGGNFCRNVVLLFKRNLISGEKDLLKIFTSNTSAKYYRRKKFHAEVNMNSTTFQDMYPIEKWTVTIQSEVYPNNRKGKLLPNKERYQPLTEDKKNEN